MKNRATKNLSKEAIIELERGHKEGIRSRYRNRCQAVLLFHVQGKKMQELLENYGIDRDTLSRWLNRYEGEGISGLKDRKKSGRPIKSEKELIKKI
jgi:transposase